jgi:hypothetical protein
MDFAPAVVLVALIAFIGFQQWLRHSRRIMIHRERLAALEKGVELPPLEQEVQRGSWNVQRILLLAGLCWISLGFGAFMVLSALLNHPSELVKDIPQGLQWIGLAPVGIGLAHLIVYAVERKESKKER